MYIQLTLLIIDYYMPMFNRRSKHTLVAWNDALYVFGGDNGYVLWFVLQKVIFIRLSALSTELTNHTLLILRLQECWCVDWEVMVSNPCRTTSHGLAPGLSAIRQINHH